MRLLPVRTLQREKEKDHVIIFIEDQKKKIIWRGISNKRQIKRKGKRRGSGRQSGLRAVRSFKEELHFFLIQLKQEPKKVIFTVS